MKNLVNQLEIFEAEEYCVECDCWLQVGTCKCEK